MQKVVHTIYYALVMDRVCWTDVLAQGFSRSRNGILVVFFVNASGHQSVLVAKREAECSNPSVWVIERRYLCGGATC